MKNLLLILAFVLISLTGFSQTFTLSSSTPGQTIKTYTISTPNGNGYGYIYNLSASNSSAVIVAPPVGTMASLSSYGPMLQGYGSGEMRNLYLTSTMQIVVIFQNQLIPNASCWSYAQIYVFPR